MFYFVCFDIVDDRARRKVAKVLKEYGQRVQKSVFECSYLNEKKFLKLSQRIEDLIDNSEDTVRYYFSCSKCLKKFEYTGIGQEPSVKDYKVI